MAKKATPRRQKGEESSVVEGLRQDVLKSIETYVGDPPAGQYDAGYLACLVDIAGKVGAFENYKPKYASLIEFLP